MVNLKLTSVESYDLFLPLVFGRHPLDGILTIFSTYTINLSFVEIKLSVVESNKAYLNQIDDVFWWS
jgi:hypothetical protein